MGLALCEEDSSLAFPHGTLQVKGPGEVAAAVAKAAREAEAQEVILGLPLLMNGEEGPAARKARALAAQLERALGVRVVLWDERLTTVSAERQLREAGRSAKNQRQVVDQAAATVLLQSYLDAQQGSTPPPVEGLDIPPPPGRRDRRRKGRR